MWDLDGGRIECKEQNSMRRDRDKEQITDIIQSANLTTSNSQI